MWVDCAHVPAVLLGGRLYMGNKGMMTVEASVVVPIILIIVVTEFFFGLFLIDMSVVKSETMRWRMKRQMYGKQTGSWQMEHINRSSFF